MDKRRTTLGIDPRNFQNDEHAFALKKEREDIKVCLNFIEGIEKASKAISNGEGELGINIAGYALLKTKDCDILIDERSRDEIVAVFRRVVERLYVTAQREYREALAKELEKLDYMNQKF